MLKVSLSFELIIPVKDPKIGIAMNIAITPDNIFTPPGIEVKSDFKDKTLKILILVSNNSGRFLHAFNDLIRCLIAIDKSINVLSQIKKKPVESHANAKKSCEG